MLDILDIEGPPDPTVGSYDLAEIVIGELSGKHGDAFIKYAPERVAICTGDDWDTPAAQLTDYIVRKLRHETQYRDEMLALAPIVVKQNRYADPYSATGILGPLLDQQHDIDGLSLAEAGVAAHTKTSRVCLFTDDAPSIVGRWVEYKAGADAFYPIADGIDLTEVECPHPRQAVVVPGAPRVRALQRVM